MLELASVDLISLYVAECNYLAEIAAFLGKDEDAKELKARSEMYEKKFQELWDDKTGIFRDKYLESFFDVRIIRLWLPWVKTSFHYRVERQNQTPGKI